MSRSAEARGPRDLARELGRRANAVAALVTLRDYGDSSLDELAKLGSCRDDAGLACDLRWLAAAGLVRRASGAGSWDVTDTASVYLLSRPGQALADSLAALAQACDKLGERHSSGRIPVD